MRYTGMIYIQYRYMYEQFFICQATGIKHRTLTDINHVVLKGLSFLLTLKMFDIVNSLITSSWQLIRIGKIILSLLAKNKIPCGWLYSGYSLKIKMKQNWDTICSTPNVKSLCTRDNRCCCNTLYNLSLNFCNIPAIWKHAIVVPIPKPKKQLDQGTSYRPISLLCPAVKVLERLLKPELDSLPLSSSQHEFRSNHSTITALLPLAHKLAQGFNQPCPPPRT